MKASPIVNFLYRLGLAVVQILSLLLLILCTISGFCVNYYADDMDSQIRVAHQGNSFLHLFMAAIIFLLLFLGSRFVFSKTTMQKLSWVFSISLLLGISFLLIVFGRTAPAADAYSVYAIGESFASGDYGAIHPTDSYLSYYPQQIGLAGFYDIFFRVLHLFHISTAPYHFVKICNVLFAIMILFFLCKISELLFEDARCSACCMLLTAVNLPLIFYTSFVYSELPSFAFLSAGIYCLLHWQKKSAGTWDVYKIGSLFLFMISVLLRKNSLVIIIAVLLVVLLESLFHKKMGGLLYCLALMILCLSVLPTVQKIYESKADNTLKRGVPATTYFAMGMQEASRGCGWYNGFNFNTYQNTGMDTEQTKAIAQEAIKERLGIFQTTPGYAIEFYKNKFLTQWTDGSFFCREATKEDFGGRSEWVKRIYDGDLSPLFMHYCNSYQLLLYVGALLGVLFSILKNALPGKKENSLPYYLCLIGVLGGFFFHMIWEANSRYILLYSFLLIPYCARGLTGPIKNNES